MAINFLTGQSIDGNLSVLGGSITLGGISGRIQGIVTVLSGTDATSKTYVDNAITNTTGNYLPLSAGSSYPLTGGLHIPHYIYHAGNTGTVIGYPSVNRFVIGTNSVTRVDVTDAGLSLGDYQTNVSVSTILDEDDMASDSATALVTQQSIKAYVDAQTPGAGVFLPLAGGTMTGQIIMGNASGSYSHELKFANDTYTAGVDFQNSGELRFIDRSGGRESITFNLLNGSIEARNTGNTVTNFISTSGNSYFNGGNVGIGVTTPYGKLDVGGNIRLQSANRIYFAGTGSIPYWTAGVDDTTNNNFVIGGQSYYSGDRDILLTPANNGNVGIGTTSPNANLEVSKVGTAEVRITGAPNSGSTYGGTSNLWLRTSTYGNSLIAFGPSGSSQTAATAAAGISYNDFGSKMTIKTNYSDRLTIDSAGAVRVLGSGSASALEFGSYGGRITSNYNTLETNYNFKVNGAVIVKDLNTAASSSYAGGLRYRVSGNNSYVDMCMQTGATTYAWVNIVQNNW